MFLSGFEHYVGHGFNVADLEREHKLGGNMPFMDYSHLFDERDRNNDYEPKHEPIR